MSSYPIAGNQYFSSVNNTVVNTTTVNSVTTVADIRPLKIVQGYVTPTSPGVYAVKDASGNNITLESNALMAKIIMRSTNNLASGTNAQPGLSATAGGAATALTGVVSTADLILGEIPPITETTGLTNTYLSITTTGTYTAGSIFITVIYFDSEVA